MILSASCTHLLNITDQYVALFLDTQTTFSWYERKRTNHTPQLKIHMAINVSWLYKYNIIYFKFNIKIVCPKKIKSCWKFTHPERAAIKRTKYSYFSWEKGFDVTNSMKMDCFLQTHSFSCHKTLIDGHSEFKHKLINIMNGPRVSKFSFWDKLLL